MIQNCILCNSEKIKKIFCPFNTHGRNIINQKEKFDLYKCIECMSIFIGHIVIDEEYYKKYYNIGYYNENKIMRKNFISNILCISKFSNNMKEKFILKSFKNINNNTLSILDVGCGSGNFLSSLDNNKFDKRGIEINPEGFRICISRGLQVYNQAITKIDFQDKKFHVITLWHVLEHIEKPQELFHKIHEILSEDGVLVFQVPNSDSLGFKYGKEYWFHLDAPRHLIIYNKKSINFLCTKIGFKIVEIRNEFYDYPLDLFWSIRKSPIKFLIYPLYPIVKLFSKESLTVVCKKI